ncbi:MAG: FAD-dependent thymidylate synthase [Elusimicrobiota bacterium]
MIIKILSVTRDAEKIIEKAARTCYQSSDKIAENSHKDFIKRLIKAGHLSVLEHGYITIRLKNVSRSLTHQLVRHRLCSFSQRSQRYVSEHGFSYTIPPKIEKDKKNKEIFTRCMNNIRNNYKEMVESGIPKEDARYVLPNSCHTEIVFSCNFRELRHMFELRGSIRAQWEIRKTFIGILRKVKKLAPSCFYDFKIDEEKMIIKKEK